MGIRTANGYIALLAKQVEAGIISSGNPFVEEYLDTMDCSVEVELTQLRELQVGISRHPDTEPSISFTVLKKYLYGWKEADKFLACLGLKGSEVLARGYYAALRA